MTEPLKPLSLDVDEDWGACEHDVVPYGDGTDGRCKKCGEVGFALVDEGDPEFPTGKVAFVLQPEHREELLARLRARKQT